MDNALLTAGTNTQPDPQKDRRGAPVPPRISDIIAIVQVLTAYGRHLAGIVTNPTLGRGFVTIARFFGTVAVLDIVPRIQRGLMRAIALQAMLLGRAQRGQDLVIPAASNASPRKACPTTKPPAPKSPSPKTPAPSLTLGNMPTQQEIEAWVRRRPIGQIIAAICLDLGISPTLCAGPFWNQVFEALQDYRGNLGTVMREFRRRVERFEREDWKRSHLPWPERTREGVYSALGFFIGEDSFHPEEAASTDPP